MNDRPLSVDTLRLKLRSRDVDMYRRLRGSELFMLLQEASIRHTEALGMGREKTLDRGILWVLLMQRAEITRMPCYDEEVLLKSWPGTTMHLLFPRYYAMETVGGEPLLKASAIWGLVDAETRKVVFPERYGIEIPGVTTGEEIPLPSAIPKRDCGRERDFTVPYSFVDLNGHMNNSRYLDLAEDCIGASARGLELRELGTEYMSEVRFGETLRLRWSGEEGEVFLSGSCGDRQAFRMRLVYREPDDSRT